MYDCICSDCNSFIGKRSEINNRNCPKCGTRLQFVDHRIYEMWKSARVLLSNEKNIRYSYSYPDHFSDDGWIDP